MWLDDLLSVVDFSKYFPQGKSTGRDQIIVNCPYHDDKVASLSVNLRNGMFYCHACGKAGNFITWAKDQNIDLKQLAGQYQIITDEQVIKPEQAEQAHKKLLKNAKALKWLTEKRGLTLKTIKQFKLGMAEIKGNGCYTIPIFDLHNNLVNIRLYNPMGKSSGEKFMSWKAGLGIARLFPAINLYEPEVMLCEGEMDTILACQMGYHAVTSTAGSKTFKESWSRYFAGKKVVICYDIDQAGIAGAHKIAKILQSTAAEIRVINLPLDREQFPTGDFTDYIVSLAATKKMIDILIQQATLIEIIKPGEPDDYKEVTLSQATRPEYDNKMVKFKSVVSGKNIESYFIPSRVKASCTFSAGPKLCPYCKMTDYENGQMEMDIDYMDREILALYACSDRQQTQRVKDLMNIPNKCEVVEIEQPVSNSLQEIVLVPEIEYTTNLEKDENYVVRPAVVIGQAIETNKAYEFSGLTVTHPKSQSVVHLITKAKPALTVVDGFVFTEQKHKRLKEIFGADDKIQEKMDDIYNDTIVHVSGIKGRVDLFIATLLTYCSPLHFIFEGRTIKKGWVETLILGDTRTGKTEMLRSLIEYFKAGELVLGESASFAGLIGGLQQIGSQWQLNWGRIPLNDRRLVVIDEMSGLATWEIGKLSGIRSSGIAEITKIRTERTFARTRLLWLSNPRGSREEQQRLLASYSQGVRAVPELIGKPEDISRFDMVLFLGATDVSREVISQQLSKPEQYKYSSDDFHDLIMWCWKTFARNIIFKSGTEILIHQLANKLGEKYDQNIPLVMDSEQHIKLARLSVAIAAMTYSSPDGQTLEINPAHIEFAYNYLNKIFDKPICAYNEFSRLEKARYNLKDPEDIVILLKRNKSSIDQLLDLEKMTQGDIQEIFDIANKTDLRQDLNTLITSRAIRRVSQGYIKTPAFIKFLRENRNGTLFEDEQMPQEILPTKTVNPDENGQLDNNKNREPKWWEEP